MKFRSGKKLSVFIFITLILAFGNVKFGNSANSDGRKFLDTVGMTMDEFLKKAETVLNAAIDSDKDGELSDDELNVWIEIVDVQAAKTQAEKVLVDTKTGSYGLNFFLEKYPEIPRNQVESYFAFSDSNIDGVLDVDEGTTFFLLMSENVVAGNWLTNVKRFDADADGMLDEVEFAKLVGTFGDESDTPPNEMMEKIGKGENGKVAVESVWPVFGLNSEEIMSSLEESFRNKKNAVKEEMFKIFGVNTELEPDELLIPIKEITDNPVKYFDWIFDHIMRKGFVLEQFDEVFAMFEGDMPVDDEPDDGEEDDYEQKDEL